MDERLLLGMQRRMVPVPPAVWRHLLHRGTGTDLSFMSPEHHRIRNFVVTELPRAGQPLSPQAIAQALDLAVDQVVVILADLESHMTFLFRNGQGEVTWAYPVTVEKTPHRITFSTGEQVYAA